MTNDLKELEIELELLGLVIFEICQRANKANQHYINAKELLKEAKTEN